MNVATIKEPSQARIWPAVVVVAVTAAIIAVPWQYQLLVLVLVTALAFGEFSDLARRILGSPTDTDMARVTMSAQTGLLLVFPLMIVYVGYEGGWQLQLLLIASIYLSDVCALFGGQKFGRHKLARRISPNKTWEGLSCGLLGAILVPCVLYPLVEFDKSLELLCLATISWTLCGAAGDLNESWLKRQADIKDSSNILRGHGGVLDRIDSLLVASVVAALWVWAWAN